MVDLVLEGGTLIPMAGEERTIESGRVVIDKKKITYCGKAEGPTPSAKKVIATEDCLILPGFVNAHTHNGMTLYRGLANDIGFHSWLFDHIFPVEQRWASPELVYWASLLGCAEMIRSGTVFFNDMYYFVEATAKAAEQAGLRSNLGIGIPFAEKELLGEKRSTLDIIEETVGRLSSYPNQRAALAPHSLYHLLPEALSEICEISDKLGLHINIHVSETEKEVADSLAQFGKTPVQFLDGLGFWNRPTTMAHAVELTEEDIEVLVMRRVGVSHNPESNLKLGNRIAPIYDLRRAGVKVGLGTDSVVSNNNLNILEEASTCARLQSLRYGPGRVKAWDVLSMLTSDGAASVGMGEQIGSLEVGKEADLIVIDASRPHFHPFHDPVGHLIYSAMASDIRDVIVQGRVVMESRKILTFDEEALLREVKQWGRKIFSNAAPPKIDVKGSSRDNT